MGKLLKNRLSGIIPILIDILFINVALVVAYILHPQLQSPLVVISKGALWDYYLTFAPITVVIRLLFLFSFGVYELKKETPTYKSIEKIFNATTLGTIIIFTIIHILRNYYFFNIGLSRYICFIEWSLNIVFLFGWRIVYFQFIPKISRKKSQLKNAVILGVSEEGLHYFSELKKIPFQHWNVIGYLTLNKKQKKSTIYPNASIKYLDDSTNLLEVINRYQIEHVILADNECPPAHMDELIYQCYALGIRVFILPRLYERFAEKIKLQPLESVPIFEVIWDPISGFNQLLKRLFDILFSLSAIVLFAPIMILIAISIKLTSKGPIFFNQIRIGKDNKPFVIYKFRSMIDRAEQISGPVWAEDNDARITKIGKLLRKASMDELPQLFLVLLGKLSIVGPRPERPHFVYKYKDFQGLRLRIKPGLTGLAQINGRYEANLSKKIYNDIYYINNYSFYLDMIIVVKTVCSVATGKGAR